MRSRPEEAPAHHVTRPCVHNVHTCNPIAACCQCLLCCYKVSLQVTQQVACLARCRHAASALFLPVCSADPLHFLSSNPHFIPAGRGGTRKVGAEGKGPQVAVAAAVVALVGPASVA